MEHAQVCPSDKELLEFVWHVKPRARSVEAFPDVASRELALVLYVQDQRLRRIEAALGLS
jgi:hypothetical protein